MRSSGAEFRIPFTISRTRFKPSLYLAVYCEKFRADASIPAEIDFMTDFLAEGCAATIDKWLIGDGGLSKEQLVDSLYRMTPEELR